MVSRLGLIGTFHKTGTVLIKSIFEEGARQGLLNLWQAESQAEPEAWTVCFAEHCHFPEAALKPPHHLAVLIRDPRDVIISGAHYHCRAEEAWLNIPENRFGGRSYRDAICALRSDEERFAFEMENAGGDTIRHMAEVLDQFPNADVVKYETLISDHQLLHFDRLLTELGIDLAERTPLLRVAYDHSLFGGAKSLHIRDGSAEQWRSAFSPAMMSQFSERFDEVAIRLGYAPTFEGVGEV